MAFSFEEKEKWLKHLEDEGYCVISGVIDEETKNRVIAEYWDCIEAQYVGVKRDELDTWKKWRVDRRGIVLKGALMHCQGAWDLRSHPNVKSVFSSIWNTDDLIVSFDSPLIWQPWDSPNSSPRTEGLHRDQNLWNKPDRCCVQSMLCLYDVTEETGGLEVVPRSHTKEAAARFRKRYPGYDGGSEFCVLDGNDPDAKGRILLTAPAGSLIMWDSRLIHGGLVGTGGIGLDKKKPRLARLSQTICMIPRPQDNEELLAWRRSAFKKGLGSTHDPAAARVTAVGGRAFKHVELTEQIDELL